MTAETTSFVYVTYIHAPAEKVFEAITRPEVARRYWGHGNISDWQPGSDWRHVRDDGAQTVNIVGKVLDSEPPRRLVLSWTGAADADRPETYSRVTFEIVDYDDMVRLTVTHDDLVPGSGMASGVTRGWPIVLSSLKSLLETGRGLDVFARPRAALREEDAR
jgi:uncharacterized protein YndB with AHSA1/START domain